MKMPLVSTSPVMATTAPKSRIGFSIDSIVGDKICQNKSSPPFSPNSDGSERSISPLSDRSFSNDSRHSPKMPTSPQTAEMQSPNTSLPRIPCDSPPTGVQIPGFYKPPVMQPHLNTPEMIHAAHNQYFLAAQLQAAAASAHMRTEGFPMPHQLPPHLGHFPGAMPPRDSYPLYPWLMSRHGRIFPHRFAGSE